MNYSLLDAARSFVSQIRNASDEDLEKVYQVLATNANDSEYASTAEPLSGICVAIQAEFKRRLVNAKFTAEEQQQPEPEEPFTNDDRVFGPEEN